ncbi:MAG: pyrroline-5-carboxylate reductase [Lachnospiraceae bacterium]|nr:pyrroline-5-carboxylate reductase [Lachnospiraceae bacterium]
MKQFGFIGMGNMAKALAQGFITAGVLQKEQVFAYAPNQEKLKKNAQEIGFTPVSSLQELADTCDTLIVACKPYQIETVLAEISGKLGGKVLLSVAAGWDYAKYETKLADLGVDAANMPRIQFIMPNTPAMVSEGVLLFEEKNSLTSAESEKVREMFTTLGIVEVLPSHLMGIGGAVSGCGPAFVDVMMEAYADAAVKYGIQRDTAYRLVAQMVLGSAKLQQQTGLHPGVLKDQVCSPGGTTIRGVAALEENGFRNACISSIDAIMCAKQNESK